MSRGRMSGPLKDAVDAVLRDTITRALHEHNGNRSAVCRVLSLSHHGLIKTMRRLGIDIPSDPANRTLQHNGSRSNDSRIACPECGGRTNRTVDVRTSTDGSSVRRRRMCACGARFTTRERVITAGSEDAAPAPEGSAT